MSLLDNLPDVIEREDLELKLEIFSHEDYDEIFQAFFGEDGWYQDHQTTKYLGDFPRLWRKKYNGNSWVGKRIEMENAKNYKIIYKGEFIGYVGVSGVVEGGTGHSIDLVIGDSNYWDRNVGKIVGATIVQETYKTGFEEFRCEASIFNKRSNSLIQNAYPVVKINWVDTVIELLFLLGARYHYKGSLRELNTYIKEQRPELISI